MRRRRQYKARKRARIIDDLCHSKVLKLKICFFDDAHTFGGAQIAAVSMAKYMQETMGLEVSFTCAASNARLIERLNQVEGVDIRRDGYAAMPLFIVTHFLLLWKIPSIIAKMRAAKGDVVIINMAGLEFGWLYIYAAKILKIRKVYWLHNTFLYTELIQRSGWRHTMDAVRDRLADIFSKWILADLVTVSNSARESLLQRLGLRSGVKVLGNTVTLPPSRIPTEINLARAVLNGYAAKTVAVVPGRVTFGHKGQDKVVACLSELERNSVAVIFIGDGDDLGRLKQLCAGHANAFFVGWQESIAAYMQDADVVLLPSRFETQGLIAIEAMYLQVPVLTSGIPAFAELMGKEFIVDFDKPAELCEKIEWICRLDKERLASEYAARLEICCGNQYKNRILRILEETKG